MNGLTQGRDLLDDAIAYIAARSGRPARELRTLLNSRTLHDYEYFAQALPVESGGDGPAVVCHFLIRQAVGGLAISDDLAATMNDLLAGCDPPWYRVVIALAGLLPAGQCPALILALTGPGAGDLSSLERAGRVLAELAGRCPTVPVALAAESSVLQEYIAGPVESRARALVREGLIPINALNEAALIERVREQGINDDALTVSLRRLAADGSSEELADAFVEAARQADSGDPVAWDLARSAAERFLFERLETLPETAGRFVLNAKPGFSFGQRPAEVDLLAEDWRLAVELDGWYYHTIDRDNYRRDRRKDWELQRRGYLVLRFLSDDVASRLEEILDTILAAIERRREPTVERGVE
jgi:hypothetical protein